MHWRRIVQGVQGTVGIGQVTPAGQVMQLNVLTAPGGR